MLPTLAVCMRDQHPPHCSTTSACPGTWTTWTFRPAQTPTAFKFLEESPPWFAHNSPGNSNALLLASRNCCTLLAHKRVIPAYQLLPLSSHALPCFVMVAQWPTGQPSCLNTQTVSDAKATTAPGMRGDAIHTCYTDSRVLAEQAAHHYAASRPLDIALRIETT